MSLIRNIVGCWSPSLGATGYLLRDVSGQNNHCTLTNMDATNWRATERGLSLNYDDPAIEKIATLGRQLPGVSGQPLISVAMWAKRNAASTIANIGQVQGSTYWNIVPFQDGNVYFQISPNFYAVADNTTTWHLWCMTLQSSVITGYRDGLQVASGVGPALLPAVAANFVIGAYTAVSTKANAIIGECAVWMRALTAPEIAELYRRGNGWLGRELTGMNQRRTYAKKLANRRRRLLCGGMT